MNIAKRCKGCGEIAEDDSDEFPRQKSVLDGHQVFWLRFWLILFLGPSVLAGIISWFAVEDSRIVAESEAQLLKDPTVKVDIQELPNSRPIRKFTREAKP